MEEELEVSRYLNLVYHGSIISVMLSGDRLRFFLEVSRTENTGKNIIGYFWGEDGQWLWEYDANNISFRPVTAPNPRFSSNEEAFATLFIQKIGLDPKNFSKEMADPVWSEILKQIEKTELVHHILSS